MARQVQMHDWSRALYWLWKQSVMRGVRARPRPFMFDLAYLLPDPWGLETAQQRARYEWTTQLVLEQFGKVQSLLEIGCGEGQQSRHLLPICQQLTGVDLSRRAVMRARERVPEARFVVGNPLAVGGGFSRAPFELALACEVIYYAKEPAFALAAMSRLARNSLVTLHEPSAGSALSHLWRLAGENRASLSVGGTTWLAAWWRNEPEAARPARTFGK